MPEVAPTPKPGGYQHPDVLLAEHVQAQLDALPTPFIPGRDWLIDHWRRDLSAHTDRPFARVTAHPDLCRVMFWMDERTAAVLMHAGVVLASQYEAHALEVRRVADGMPHGSYGAQNRLEIAQRRERVAGRIWPIWQSYQAAVSLEYYGI